MRRARLPNRAAFLPDPASTPWARRRRRGRAPSPAPAPDGIVARVVHAQVPPKVEDHTTEWGQSLCPALDELLTWAEERPTPKRPRKSSRAP
ncbi:MAG: winged helix-turn-helix transcriptional regulator [Labilithrix sp.]|nr:winged helix-turn-helix transcriptional regulator [Labilithrix sp.]